MRKISISRQKREGSEICARISQAIIKKEISKIPFMLYHLVKQCPDGTLCKEIRKRDYSKLYTYFKRGKARWGKNQMEQCVKKLDELIL
jgi:glutamate formiminotransferase